MKTDKKKIIFIPIFILFAIVILAGSLAAIYYFKYKSPSKGQATIELSTSFDKIYLGGSGEVNAVLHYSGDDSVGSGNFIYECDRPDLVVFEKRQDRYTGKYNVTPKQNEDAFGDVNVHITVSCADDDDIKPAAIQITVTDAKPFTIEFFKNREDSEPTQINIYEGYSIAQINNIRQTNYEIPDCSPSDNFNAEWYDKKTDKFVEVNEDTAFYGESGLQIYARYRLNKNLTLNDELNAENSRELNKDIFKVYYDEPLSNELANELQKEVQPYQEWEFKGWFPDVNSDDRLNGLDTDGNYCLTTNVLTAKWSKKITLVINDVITDNESLKEANVIFNTIPEEITEINPQYSKGGKFSGWYTQPNGDGTQVLTQNKFTYKDINKLYNKISFTVKMDPYNGLSESIVNYSGESSYNIIYGKTLSQQFNTLGSIQPYINQNIWTFDSWYLSIDGNEVPIEEGMNIPLTGVNILGKVNLDSDGNINVLSKWSCKVHAYNKFDAQNDKLIIGEFTAYNNSTIDISQQPWGDWSFGGWYSDKNQLKEAEASPLANEYRGVGETTIYGKWTCHSHLIYQNDKNDREDLNFTYGIENSNLPTDNVKYKEKFGVKSGYAYFLAWSTDRADTHNTYRDSINRIDVSTVNYPKVMSNIYAVWQPEEYTVNLFDTNISGEKISNALIDTVKVYSGEFIQTVKLPEKNSDENKGTFNGYFYTNGQRYVDSDGKGSIPWNLYGAQTFELLAGYNQKNSVIIIDNQNGVGGISQLDVSLNAKLPSYISPLPTRLGYTFDGYYSQLNGNGDKYYDEFGVCQKNDNWDGKVTTLYANWKAYPIKIIGVGSMINIKDWRVVSVNVDFANGSSYSYSVSDNDGHLIISNGSGKNIESGTFNFSVSRADRGTSGKVSITVTDKNSQASFTRNYNYTTDGGCFVAGTLITMGDGTQKKIEDIHVGDMVLSWNFMTGQAESVPVGQYYKLQDEEADLLSLHFSDGTKIDIVYSHGFFDLTLNEFVFIDSNNYREYIGHEFIKYEDGAVNTAILQSVDYSIEDKEFFAIVTVCNYNAFAEGFMSLTKPFIDGIYTYFEVGDDLKYDMVKVQEDIDTYGLYTYEEVLPIVQSWGFEVFPYEYFVAVNVQYYKILLGKGIVTFDDIIFLINEMIGHS